MDATQRARASRRGGRSSVTKLLAKAHAITQPGTEVTPQSISQANRDTIDLVLSQLSVKKRQLEELDQIILAAITTEKELEDEVTDTEMYHFELAEKIASLKKFSMPSTPNITSQPSPPTSTQQQRQEQEVSQQPVVQQNNAETGATGNSTPSNSVSNSLSHTPVVHDVVQSVCQLPKLTLPTFSGDSLQFQTFWDSFEAAVHNSKGLTGVQKFHYLRAQLLGDAAHVIDNLPLTDLNYEHSVALLKDRFGQPYKLVNAHMDALMNLPKPVNNLASLQAFHDKLESHMRALQSLGKSHDTYSAMLTPMVLGKLPIELRKQFARDHSSGEWTIKEVMACILKELRVLEVGHYSNGFSKELHSATASFHTAARKPIAKQEKREPACTYCKGPHTANQCTVVKGHQQRTSIVKAAGLCFNCLGNHRASQCTSRRRCKHCSQKHHTSLCPPTDAASAPVSAPVNNSVQPPPTTSSVPPSLTNQTQPVPPQVPLTNSTGTYTTVTRPQPPLELACSACLLKTAIATVSAGSISTEGNILFDEGAQRSFISQELADTLCLRPTRSEQISLSSFGNQASSARFLQVATILVHTQDRSVIPISVLVVPQLAAPLQNSVRMEVSKMPHLKNLQLAHPVTEDDSFEITILVGADYYWTFVQDQVIRGNGPTAVKSRLGYLLSGPLLQPSTTVNLVHVNFTVADSQNLDTFWKLESSGTSPSAIDNGDDFLKTYMQTSIARQPDGTLSLKFPWKEDHPFLPSNLPICAKRTRSLAQRLAKDPELLSMYGQIIAEQESKGFIEKVDNFNTKQTHYIPHRAVRKDSATTPVRIVYDCSCRQSAHQPSLNDCLHVGPPFLNHLCAILLRFRLYVYGFSADIEKAFLHVQLDKSDRDFTRFLWPTNPNDPNSPFQVYRFKVVLFGASCSPFMLNAALTYHLQQHPSAVSTSVARSLYVDNVVSGCDTEEEAIQYFLESRSLMNLSKFNLRTWASNSPSLRALAKQYSVAETKDTVKVLGLCWDVGYDKLSLCSKPEPIRTPVTKREILRYTSSIFDPLGLVTPVTITTKLLLQELWQDNVSWDIELNNTYQLKWTTIVADISIASQQCFPRQCIPKLDLSSAVLHVFADASPKAYGAAVYLQCGNYSSLLISKSRVAPLKQHTLPRLELMAAVIAAHLGSFVVNSLNHTVTTIYWSDSQIVLCWLQSRKKLKPFIDHRVKEILAISSSWKYCPTASNPADLLTRGLSADQFIHSTLWRHGPPWLSSPTEWPTWSPSEALVVLANSVEGPPSSASVHNTTLMPPTSSIYNIIDPSTHSSYTKLLDITAYVLRFSHNTRQKLFKLKGPLTPSELSIANTHWVSSAQLQGFPEEVSSLCSKTRSPQPPLVRQLRLYLDHSGIIRCGGRIHNAPLSESTKFPLLLPSKDPFTSLLIWHTHKQQHHAGVTMTLTALCQMYWVPCARQRIRALLRKCVTCRKLAGRPYTAPDPPPLVKARVQQSQPFEVTGVDFTGALFVRGEGQGERKVYLCLFTCAVTRAVHLEIVTDLSVECFLQAFWRFSSRKSMPRLVLSDNASTFLSAAEQLKALLSSPSLTNALSKSGTEWKFIPKRAPWFGGFWERLIGLTKLALKKVLGRTFTTLNSLQTLVVEIEAILNDRPLTYVPTDISDPDPITPSHLLYGRKIVCVPYHMTPQYNRCDPDYGEAEIQSMAKKQAALLQHFWTRWRKEYLTSLREFHRASDPNIQTVKPGAVVLVHDDTPRISWRLAVVEDTIAGEDGLVRAANIRTSTGKTNRPVAKLYPLEVTAADPLLRRVSTVQDKSVNSDDQAVNQEESSLQRRPVRTAAIRGRQQVKEWTQSLCGPPEDVEN
ncbi:uncharacterized protein [Dysidea avara]|uniref:uncharacterized protein n=1 Tax=Dysidea avara TaxID=196820 RepID=UPI0033320C55